MSKRFSPDEMNEKLEGIVLSTQEFLAGYPTDTFIPTVVILGEDDRSIRVLIPDLPDTSQHKARLMGSLGAKLAVEMPDFVPVAVFFVGEVWYKSISEEEATRGTKRPSEYKDRQEGVAIAGTTPDEIAVMAVVPITRDRDNNILLEEEAEFTSKAGEDSEESLEITLLNQFFISHVVGDTSSARGVSLKRARDLHTEENNA